MAYEYDIRGRLKKVTRADGTVTTLSYNASGRLINVSGPQGPTSYAYDVAGRISSVTGAGGDAIHLEYDTMSNPTSITDPRGAQTTFEYDRNGRRTKTTFPNGGVATRTYDKGGRAWKDADRDGVFATYTYDAANRLVQMNFSDGSAPVSYGYDVMNRPRFAVNDVDLLSWSYPAFGELGAETSRRNGTVLKHAYNDAGQKISTALDGAGLVGFGYDAAGRLSEITHALGRFSFEYDARSRRTAMVFPNQTTTRYEYDILGRLTFLGASRGADTITAVSYTHDAAGNRLTRAGLDFTDAYRYDALSQLVEATRSPGGNQWSYRYDDAGNRIEEEGVDGANRYQYTGWNRLATRTGGGTAVVRGAVDEPSTVTIGGLPASVAGSSFEGLATVPPGGGPVEIAARDAAGNVGTRTYQLPASASGTQFSYDANGALITREDGSVWTYQWTVRGELWRVLRDGVEIVRFRYDPLGRPRGESGRRADCHVLL